MTASAIAKHYSLLSPEERFRLILAAGARNDDAECDRLVQASGRISLTMSDYSPFAHSFGELALYYYIELLDHASVYLESFVRADLVDFSTEASPDDADGDSEEGNADPHDESASEETDDDEAEWDTDARSPPWSTSERWFRHALATGFVLKTKAEGWKRFCERLSIPPFVLWQELPGFERLQIALDLTEKAAFVEEGFVRWLNEIRKTGDATVTESPLKVERIADGCDEAFRERVDWWGGPSPD